MTDEEFKKWEEGMALFEGSPYKPDYDNASGEMSEIDDKIKNLKQELDILKTRRKNLLSTILPDSLSRILESIPMFAVRAYLNYVFWHQDLNDKEKWECQVFKRAFKNTFGTPFIPEPSKHMEKCSRCGCIVWTKEYTSWQEHDRLIGTQWVCQTCWDSDKEEREKIAAAQKLARSDELKALQYKEYLTTNHWQATRKKALSSAEYRCQLCNGKGVLDVHHRTYDNLGCEKTSDLCVLCRGCHAKHHDKIPGVAKEIVPVLDVFPFSEEVVKLHEEVSVNMASP